MALSSVTFDVTTAEGLASVGAVRERFLGDPSTDLSRIRPVIARSWRRSAAMAVDPTALVEELDDGARVDEQTATCAAPFLEELKQLAGDARGNFTVASPGCAVVGHLTPSMGGRYPHGLVLLESTCGTNSDGMAHEEGRAAWVHSREHYIEDPAFQDHSCYSAPVRDPFRDSIRAIIGLTLPEAVVLCADAGAIGLIVQGLAAKITRALAARAGNREQALFNEYLKATRRYRSGPILAVDGKNAFVTASALELLRQDDFAAISSYAHETLRLRRSVNHEVTLSGGRLVQLQVSAAGDALAPVGAIVRVRPVTTARADRRGPRDRSTDAASLAAFEDIVGENRAFRQALRLAASAIELGRTAHVIGEPGVGKLTVALRIAGAWSSNLETIKCAGVQGDASALVQHIQARLDAGGSVVLRDVDLLPTEISGGFAELFRQITSPKVVLTLRRPTASAVELTSCLRSVEVAVPSLRARREDIPLLASRFICDVTEKSASPRLLFVLAQADWPGNVTQLKSTVEQAASVAQGTQGTQVTVADLPQTFHGGNRQGSLSRLEQVELQELRSALVEANGKRTLAAEILQIGRSTLYRRLDSYQRRGIEV